MNTLLLILSVLVAIMMVTNTTAEHSDRHYIENDRRALRRAMEKERYAMMVEQRLAREEKAQKSPGKANTNPVHQPLSTPVANVVTMPFKKPSTPEVSESKTSKPVAVSSAMVSTPSSVKRSNNVIDFPFTEDSSMNNENIGMAALSDDSYHNGGFDSDADTQLIMDMLDLNNNEMFDGDDFNGFPPTEDF